MDEFLVQKVLSHLQTYKYLSLYLMEYYYREIWFSDFVFYVVVWWSTPFPLTWVFLLNCILH